MSSNRPIRILVADDQRIIRESIFRLLSQAYDVLVMGEACNGAEVIEKVRAQPYDVVLLDITMPEKDGLEVLRQLRLERPNLPVVMLTVHHEFKEQAEELGASAYLTKDKAADELLDTIRLTANRM
jgi:two-component system invasion response regulator UvrY